LCRVCVDSNPCSAVSVPPPVDLLESFENHPPIVLPSGGFRVDLDSDSIEDSIYRQLLYVRHFLWGLRTKTHPTGNNTHTHPTGNNTHTHPTGNNTHTHPAVNNTHPTVNNTHTHPTVNNTHTHTPTAVNGTGTRTSTGTSTAPADWQEAQRECPLSHNTPRSGGGEAGETGEEWVTDRPPGQSHSSVRRNGTAHHPRATNQDPSCLLTPPNTPLYPEGGGADLHTPLNAPGIYIRTLIPDGPAASDGRLRIGDRILAVNGTSLIGADYQSAVDLIRLGGGRLRFLVAKSDLEVSEKISASSC
ncbi:unnamed protein product, partial [Coregonus sp. 'balchen']